MQITLDSTLVTNPIGTVRVVSGHWSSSIASNMIGQFNLTDTLKAQIQTTPHAWRYQNQHNQLQLIRLSEGQSFVLPKNIQQVLMQLQSSEELAKQLGRKKLVNGLLNLAGFKISTHGRFNNNANVFVELISKNNEIFLRVSKVVSQHLAMSPTTSLSINNEQSMMWQQIFRPRLPTGKLTSLLGFSAPEAFLTPSVVARALPLVNLQQLGELGLGELSRVFFPNLTSPLASPLTLMLWLWLSKRVNTEASRHFQNQFSSRFQVDDDTAAQLLQWAKQTSKEQTHIINGQPNWTFSLPYMHEDEVETLQVQIHQQEHWLVNLRLYVAKEPVLFKIKYWPESGVSELQIQSSSRALLKLLVNKDQQLNERIEHIGLNHKTHYQQVEFVQDLLQPEIKKSE